MADGFSLPDPRSALGQLCRPLRDGPLAGSSPSLRIIPLHQNAFLPPLLGTACFLCPWPCRVCIESKAPTPWRRQDLSDVVLANFITIKGICYHCRKKWGCRRGVSWWLSTFSLADKGLKVLQLQKSLSFNKMDSGQPWRQEAFLFDSPST